MLLYILHLFFFLLMTFLHVTYWPVADVIMDVVLSIVEYGIMLICEAVV